MKNSYENFITEVRLKVLIKDDVLSDSYIRKSLRFLYYVSLNTGCQIPEKNWGHRKNLGESVGVTFKGSDREKCKFWYVSNFQHQA